MPPAERFTTDRPFDFAEPPVLEPAPAPEPVADVWLWGLAALSRVGLVLGAVFAVLVGAPAPVTVTLSLLAVLIVAERLSRVRAQGPADAVLAGLGGVLITAVLVGSALRLTGLGPRPWSWAIGLGLVAVAGLVLAEHRVPSSRRRPDWWRAPSGPGVVWGLAAAVVVVLALLVSGRSAPVPQVSHRAVAGPAPVQMSFGPIAKTSATIVISASRPTGRLELRTQAADGTSISYPLMSVVPGRTVSTSVVLPVTGRFLITLNDPDQSAPLRSLILDR